MISTGDYDSSNKILIRHSGSCCCFARIRGVALTYQFAMILSARVVVVGFGDEREVKDERQKEEEEREPLTAQEVSTRL